MVVKDDYSRYFFSSLYDDELITNKLSSYQNHMYDPIIRGKAWIQNNRIINGDITDIQVNQDLNMRFGMPMNTYSIFLNINIVPFYSEKDFYYNYGYEKPIKISQIMKDDKVFSKYIYFFMSGYLIHDVELVILKGGHTIIFIHPKDGDISQKDLDDIIYGEDEDGMWSIMFSTRSDVYKVKKQRASLFTDNKIYLSTFPDFKKYNKPSKNNCYTLYMSAFASSYNIMSACNVNVNIDDRGEYFLVPQEFKNYICERVSNIQCMIFNEPECTGTGIYVNTEGDQPIFQIPYKKNPIPLNNLLVWQYDAKTHRKKHPLEVDVTMHYPNIYDFSEMIKESYYVYLCEKSKAYIVDKNGEYIILSNENGEKVCDLFIEWIEPTQDCMIFHSYIQDYIDYEPDYCEMVVNNTLPEEFTRKFDPIKNIPLGALDYYHSEFYGDYRAWRLDCLHKILRNNPKKYDELYHEIYYKIREYYTRCYNYEKESDIYNRSIMNNHDHCIEDKDNRITFDVPHTYLHVYDHCDEIQPLSLFIAGILTNYTFAMKRGPATYVYFQKEYLDSEDSIQLDMELIHKKIENAEIAFNSNGGGVDLEKVGFKDTHSLSNLILYDKDGNYIDKNDFTFINQIEASDVIYTGDSNLDSAYNDDIYLYTKDDELVVPTDADCIIVKREEVEYEIGSNESTKDTNLNNVVIKPTNDKYFGNWIYVGTTDFCQRKVFNISENEDVYDIMFHKFKGKPSLDRFKVYTDGLILSPSEYDITFEGYDKDVTIHFHESVRGERIDIHYIGYDDELIYDGVIDDLSISEEIPIIFLRDILETPYDSYVYKIYIDGFRISDDLVYTLGQSNILYINSFYAQDSNIMIYRQKMDDEVYGYESDVQFLDETAINDLNFLEYLFDKYVRRG